MVSGLSDASKDILWSFISPISLWRCRNESYCSNEPPVSIWDRVYCIRAVDSRGSSIISYTSRYKTEAAAAHEVKKSYYLAETNSATCGGGGISPTFGAALWIIDYSIQAALQGVERLYFHQGTIAACPYCWWNR
jgi:hypothetical protein